MKKVFAIIAIVALAACAVFAADSETHKIKVGTTISEVVPSFQFKYGSVYTNSAADANTIKKGGQTGQFAANHDDANYATGKNYVDTGVDLSKDDITAEFYAVLAVGARSQKGYTLTFKAGSFDAKAANQQRLVPCTSCSLESQIASDSVVVKAVGDVVETGDNQKAQDIEFLGSPATAKTDLFKFTATWTKDNTLDMGTWFADVTMTVAAK